MHMRMLARMVAAVALFAASSLANSAAYTFTQIDVPGAAWTYPVGINDAGQIVGGLNPDNGFLYSGGSFIPIDVPGANGTLPFGINDAGLIVGIFRAPNKMTLVLS